MEFDRRSFLGLTAGGFALSMVGGTASASLTMSSPATAEYPQSGTVKRLIIDTDPGVDDAVAIMLALKSKEVNVEALTVVAGNVETQYGVPNALAVLEVAGRQDIPVAEGATKPLMRALLTAKTGHGANGMGGVSLPPAKAKPIPQHAADFIIERVKRSPHELAIICIGPLTNAALALIKDPSIAPLIKELAFMGGTILSNGNTTPVATFNIYNDPEAARIVVNSGIPKITMVGTDVTTKVRFDEADCQRLEAAGKPVPRLVAALAGYRLERSKSALSESGAKPMVGFNDLPAMTAIIQPSLFQFELLNLDIETKGELTTGMTVVNRRGRVQKFIKDGDHLGYGPSELVKPNVDVATGIDDVAVRKLFIERILS